MADELTTDGSPRRRRGRITLVACTNCHRKKTACDGKRPQCSKCLLRKQTCHYDTEDQAESRLSALRRENDRLRKRISELQEHHSSHFVEHIMNIRDGAYQQLYSDLYRHSAIHSPTTYLLSPHDLQRSMLPSSSSWLEYELMIQYPDTYGNLKPLDSSAIQSNFDMINSLYTALGQGRNGAIASENRTTQAGTVTMPSARSNTRDSFQALQSVGFDPHLPHCDQRLSQLHIGPWTKVAISSKLAAYMISWYLEIDHPNFGFFDADLFVRDLVGWRDVHCSRLLVHIILLWISHALDVSVGGVELLRSSLLTETMSEWEKANAQRSDRIPDAAAALLLSNHLSCMCQDVEGQNILRAAYSMGLRAGCFGPPLDIPHSVSEENMDNLRGTAHFAWGLFNYVTFLTFHYHDLVMELPPRYPIPGDGGILAYDDFDVACYHTLPVYMGTTFTRACEFFLISNEIALAYYCKPLKPVLGRIPIQFVESTFRKLLTWSTKAQKEPLGKSVDSLHWKIQHIHFHATVIDLFTPFQHTKAILATFRHARSTPYDIIWASGQQLKYLILTLSKRKRICVMWHNALLHIINAALDDLRDAEKWFFFLLCLRSYQVMSNRYPIMGHLVKAFLNIATERGAFPIMAARTLWKQLIIESDANVLQAVTGDGSYTIDLSGASIDTKHAQAATLIEAFDRKMALLDDESDKQKLLELGAELPIGGDGGMKFVLDEKI